MKPFDSYEISPCVRLNDEGQPDPNGNTFEVCEPDQAHCWTLYGHIPGEGVQAIGDFATREDAEEVFQRITGIPFGSHEEIQARLRVMHAGERLLNALQSLAEQADEDCPQSSRSRHFVEALEDAIDAIAEAEARSA